MSTFDRQWARRLSLGAPPPRPVPPSEDAMSRAYEAAGQPVAPPPVGELPDEWQPDPSAPRRLWHVRSCTVDGTPAPPSGTWPSYLPGEALQTVVAQAKAEGWPIGQLRWTVTPCEEEIAP